MNLYPGVEIVSLLLLLLFVRSAESKNETRGWDLQVQGGPMQSRVFQAQLTSGSSTQRGLVHTSFAKPAFLVQTCVSRVNGFQSERFLPPACRKVDVDVKMLEGKGRRQIMVHFIPDVSLHDVIILMPRRLCEKPPVRRFWVPPQKPIDLNSDARCMVHPAGRFVRHLNVDVRVSVLAARRPTGAATYSRFHPQLFL